ncbi:hypothetical protein [Shewanella sp. SW24]|nr:hypothetical protein [Shewanella sp. SW24]
MSQANTLFTKGFLPSFSVQEKSEDTHTSWLLFRTIMPMGCG